MPYFIETYDKPDHYWLRLQERTAHLDFLALHADSLLACGAKLSDDESTASGGIYVVDVEDRGAAAAFIANDPFYKAGLFADVSIARWRMAYLVGTCYL
jgi:uncharacterized protein YciI